MLRRKRIWIPLALGLSCAVVIGVLARTPDFDLQMTREVPSPTTTEQLAAVIEDEEQWPRWFHVTTDVEQTAGGLVRLTVDPKKGDWKRFTLDLRVNENEPREGGGRRLALEFVSDSKNKLRPMFSDLRWEVEVMPGSGRKGSDHAKELSIVRGTIHARTNSWRARLFGRMSPRILLNQALYPDLIGLAEIEKGKPEPVLRMGM